jgi:peptidoglycan/LPS O-acetylase OafA/YrhL
MPSRNNAFDLIRHIAALMVLVSHHFVLSGKTEPALQGVNSLGGFAVVSFFAISGYLITQSFIRSSLEVYAVNRIARIFPALFVCSFIMVYLVGGFFSEGGILATAESGEALKKFLQIAAFGRANIDAVTEGFIFQESLNGSLWTLKLEFGCYVLAALALSLSTKPFVPLLVLIGICALHIVSLPADHPIADKVAIYTSVCVAFFVGSTLAFHQGLLGSLGSKIIMTGVGLVLMGAAVVGPVPLMLSSVGFSLITLALGTMLNDPLIRGRFDISYGLYLYAFPVQQLLINCTELGFYPSMAAAACVTALLATLSWFCIEKPALGYARSFRQRSMAAAKAL